MRRGRGGTSEKRTGQGGEGREDGAGRREPRPIASELRMMNTHLLCQSSTHTHTLTLTLLAQVGLTKTKRSGVFKSMSKGVTSMLRSAGREGHEVRPGETAIIMQFAIVTPDSIS